MTRSWKACLSGDRCEPRTFGEAVYCLVHHSTHADGTRITPEEIARHVGCRVGYLLEAANPDRDDTKFQIGLLIPITLYTRNTIALRFLATEANGVFFELPTTVAGYEDLLDGLGIVMEKVGENASVIRASLADDRQIDADEATRIIESLDTSIASVATLRALVVIKKQSGAYVTPGPRAVRRVG